MTICGCVMAEVYSEGGEVIAFRCEKCPHVVPVRRCAQCGVITNRLSAPHKPECVQLDSVNGCQSGRRRSINARTATAQELSLSRIARGDASPGSVPAATAAAS